VGYFKDGFFEGLNKKQKLTLGSDGYELYKDKALEMVTERLTALNESIIGSNSISSQSRVRKLVGKLF